MKINYFEDTDTASIHFTDQEVAETREVSENVYLDLDKEGNLVSMTVEHAGEKANIEKFSFERLSKSRFLILPCVSPSATTMARACHREGIEKCPWRSTGPQ